MFSTLLVLSELEIILDALFCKSLPQVYTHRYKYRCLWVFWGLGLDGSREMLNSLKQLAVLQLMICKYWFGLNLTVFLKKNVVC